MAVSIPIGRHVGDSQPILKTEPTGAVPPKQTAVLTQDGQRVLFTQDFSRLEMLLEDLSSGTLQEELEQQCDDMLDEPDLRQYFNALGLQDYVALHEQFTRLHKEYGATNDLPDSALLDYANKLKELEESKSNILASADKILDGKLNIGAGYKKIIDGCWDNFLVLIKKARGEKLEEFFDEDIDPQNSAELDATYSAIEMLASRYNGLLPIVAGQLKAQLSQQAGLCARALEYTNIIKNTLRSARSALKEDYPYFELRGFVDAQRTIGMRAEDASALLKNYRTAHEALTTRTIATIDYLILTPTEIIIGGYAPTSGKNQKLESVSILISTKALAEGIIKLYGNK
mgnify:CR=1 FL=1